MHCQAEICVMRKNYTAPGVLPQFSQNVPGFSQKGQRTQLTQRSQKGDVDVNLDESTSSVSASASNAPMAPMSKYWPRRYENSGG